MPKISIRCASNSASEGAHLSPRQALRPRLAGWRCSGRRRSLAGALFGIERAADSWNRPLSAWPTGRRFAAGHISFCQRAARRTPGGARFCARRLPICPLPKSRSAQSCAWLSRTASTANDLSRIVEGVTLCRDLINTPSNDMGPAELEDGGRSLAKQHGAQSASHERRRARQKFSADARSRRRLGARAAADRHDLGQGRRSKNHARRQGRLLSTPAGSTSSPTPACST